MQKATTPHSTKKLSVYFITSVAALGGLLFGYDTGVISGAQLFLVKTFSLNPQQQELAVSAVLIGAIIGAIVAGKVNDAFGRKKTLLLLAVIFTLGALLTAVSPNYTLFLIFRAIVGLGIGAAASVVPVYISEMAPFQMRGKLVTFNQLAVTIGIAVSYWVDLAFAHAGMGWPPMFATAAIPGILLFVGMLMSPETPRWYASRGRWAEARQVLECIEGADPELEIAEIHTSLSIEQKQGRIRDLFTPRVRMALLVGVGLAVFQQFVGINTVIYYAPTIFQSAGVSSASSAILATSVVGVVNVLATIVALLLLDKAGRRVLLISGCIGMIIGLALLGTIFATGAANAGLLTMLALMIYIISFAISMGPVFWLMSAEIFPTSVRGAGASVCSFSNWAANFIVSITFLSLIGGIGTAHTFWLYAVIGVIALVFCWYLVPETKGKTLEQIEAYWNNGRRWIKPSTLSKARLKPTP
ncbi:sugar porter family MFS transporter [Dictyobacter aurantiacus]|uniref:MFS transporter n=1 Tax=Dictyobacter aurantiacus TaxID=1936993 RepID=A0A401ZID8_9CHLR|nr:sugar porter family MFS transporter [Dictyobacter aurantiacus]GCE06598.1 MFS transporter [Dictyobacter aurantiacus]